MCPVKPIEEAVLREIDFLEHILQSSASPDARGKNLHGAVNAQLIVLRERLTKDNMIERLGSVVNDCYIAAHACDVVDWLEGRLDESPSEGWEFEGNITEVAEPTPILPSLARLKN